MFRFLAIVLATSFFILPFSAFAEKTTRETETLPESIPVYLFSDNQDGILGITPISQDFFLWIYILSPESAEITLVNPEGSPGESVASKEPENPVLTPLGLVLIPWDADSNPQTQISEDGAGIGERIYTGHEFDPDTQYTYAQARYLETRIGRFLGRDFARIMLT